MKYMPKFTISVLIDESPEIVWNAFIDSDNMRHYTKYLEKIEVVKGKFGEVGATAHLHYLEKGRSYILEDKLLEYEEEKRILSQVTGQGMKVIVESSFEKLPNGTKMTMVWDGTGKYIIMKVILWLLKGRIKKHAEAELNTFKNLVETYGVSFSEKE